MNTIELDELKASLKYVLPAAARDVTRTLVNVVHFERDELVATDGHRMHIAPARIGVSEAFNLPVFLASSILSYLKSDHEVSFQISKRDFGIEIDVGACQIVVPLDSEFPPHREVMSPVYRYEFETSMSDLKKLAKLKVFAFEVRSEALYVRAGFDTDPITDEDTYRTSELETSSYVCLDPVLVTFDPKYLADAVAMRSPRVAISFNGPLDPIMISGIPYLETAVIMPTRQ